MLQLAAELFAVAQEQLGDEADHVEVVKVVEQWAGTTIRSSAPSSNQVVP